MLSASAPAHATEIEGPPELRRGILQPVSAQRSGDLSDQGRRALQGVLAAYWLYALSDVLIGVRFVGEDDGLLLVLSNLIGLALQVLFVVLVWQRRRWAWIVGAIGAAFGLFAALATIADPTGLAGYGQDTPRAFSVVQALLVLVASGLWFAPGVRPRRLLKATPGRP